MQAKNFFNGSGRNKTIILLLALLTAILIPAQGQNALATANNTTIPANASLAINQSPQESLTTEKAIETMFLIGIILSPVSFIIAVVALWVAWKNRRKTYNVR